MRNTNFFFYMLLILALTGLMFCGSDNNSSTENGHASDSSSMNSDSTMSAHNRDPSTAYPTPPVTGSNQDSSRTEDSSKQHK